MEKYYCNVYNVILNRPYSVLMKMADLLLVYHESESEISGHGYMDKFEMANILLQSRKKYRVGPRKVQIVKNASKHM